MTEAIQLEQPNAELSIEPKWLRAGNVPSLNGLRAVSVTVVILSHLYTQLGIPEEFLPISSATAVDVFFVISGFLITLLLIREQDRHHQVSIRNFFIRRVFRIVPAYVAFLGVMYAVSLLGWTKLNPVQLLIALTYTSNIFVGGPLDPGNDLRHTWSLCVEEHFYFVWPFLFVGLGRVGAARFAIGYTLITPLIRVVCRIVFPSLMIRFFTLTRVDAILIGCCIAFALTTPRFAKYLAFSPTVARALTFASCLVLFANHQLICHFSHQSKLVQLYGNILAGTVNLLPLSAIVIAVTRYPQSTIGQFLNSGPLVVTGILSYSLYLWQQPLTNPEQKAAICQVPINVVFICLCAVLSYNLIEKPFLKLKSRMVSG